VVFVELDGVDGPRLVANLAEDTDAGIGDRVVAIFPERAIAVGSSSSPS
jgi:hypothetical protein